VKISRRSLIQSGLLGYSSLSATEVIAESKTDNSVILVWLPGGLSQLESYDPKSQAKSDVKGLFNSIPTNVVGTHISELFPLQAQIADKFTLIRSMTHRFTDHGGGSKRVMTGKEPKVPTGTINDTPSIASVVSKHNHNNGCIIPSNILLADGGTNSVDEFALGSAFLGSSYDAFIVDGDPSAKNFKVNNITMSDSLKGRIDDRLQLLSQIDKIDRQLDYSQSMSAMDNFHKKAYDLLTSHEVKGIFDVVSEPLSVRESYGLNAWGQRCLMARKLAEAGSNFVTVTLRNPPGSPPDHSYYNWDCHAVNCDIFIDMKYKANFYDQAVSGLINDIYNRGLDKNILVVVMGEFGHTPKLEYKEARGKIRNGRDHWSKAFSILVSGGGLKMGQVIGKTDDNAAFVIDRPVTPEDLWATIYRHLGIDASKVIYDLSGRPIPILADGRPIKELVI
jgi:hypothetical protein